MPVLKRVRIRLSRPGLPGERLAFGSIPLTMERQIEMKTEVDGRFHQQATNL
jgi:hypothetical protein